MISISRASKRVLAVSLIGGIWASAMQAADSPSKQTGRTGALVTRPAFVVRALATGASTLTVTPGVVSFNATNPSTSPIVPGNSPIKADIVILGTKNPDNWSLGIAAQGPTLDAGTSSIPISSVAWTATGQVIQGRGTVTAASGSQVLSTNSNVVANGGEGSKDPFEVRVNLNFNFTDNWNYEVGSYSQVVVFTMVAQ